MSTGKQDDFWQHAARVVAVPVGLLVLLVIGGWAFILGVSALAVLGYRNSRNRGLLTAAGTLVGMAVGTFAENALNITGGAAILAGTGLGLLGVFLCDLVLTNRPYLWTLVLGAGIVTIVYVFWPTANISTLLIPAIRTPFLLLVGAGVAFEYWRERVKRSRSAV